MRSARPAGVSRSLRGSGTPKAALRGRPLELSARFWGPAQRICAGPSLLTCARHPAPSLLSPGTNSVRWGAPVFAGTVYGPPTVTCWGPLSVPSVPDGLGSDRAPLRPRSLRKVAEPVSKAMDLRVGVACLNSLIYQIKGSQL